jgi:hypothetical protein
VNQLIICGYAVKTSNRESESELKENDGNAQFSLCCTSTAMPDDDSQDRHPAFCCTSLAVFRLLKFWRRWQPQYFERT